MIEANKTTVTCIEYKSDGNTTKKVKRELILLTDDNGKSFLNIAYIHIKDELNPHTDDIDVYKIEKEFAVKITTLNFNNLDERLDKPYGWWQDSPTLREHLEKYNNNDIYNLVKCEGERAVNSHISLYESTNQMDRANELRTLREERLKKQEEARQQRILKEKIEEERKAAEEKARQDKLISEAEETIKEGSHYKNIDNEQLLLLADKLGIKVHLKTRHNIIENLRSIQADGSSLYVTKDRKTHRTPTCDGIFTVFKEIRAKLSDQ